MTTTMSPSPNVNVPAAVAMATAVVALLAVVLVLGPIGGSNATGLLSDARATAHVPESGAENVTGGDPPRAENLVESVVQVVQLAHGSPNGCTGSGSIVSADGLVLTNAHVVDQASCSFDGIGIAVSGAAGERPRLTYEADLLAIDEHLDLAVLRISRDLVGEPVTQAFRELPLGSSANLLIGDQILLLGYPSIGGDTVTLTTGLVSGFVDRTRTNGGTWIKTDATIAGGSSGGAALNEAGELVGVPTTSGTGDDNFVDCRFVADTNGDGVIDERDACVPIGGFINGLRPVDDAKPLIRRAATAVPIPLEPAGTRATPGIEAVPERAATLTVSNVQLVEWVADDGTHGPAVAGFAAGVTQACVHWEYDGMAEGSSYDVALSIDGALDERASVRGDSWSGELTGTSWYCVSNPNGLTSGHYEVAFIVEGATLLEVSFLVGPQ